MKRFGSMVLALAILSFIFLLSYCKKKDEKITISGNAINQQLGTGISGISVTLSAKTITNGTWNTQFSTISSQTTQSGGSFSFTFDNIRVSEYKLSFSKTGYFTDSYTFSTDLVSVGENYNKSYAVHSEAWLKILVKNNVPTSVNDLLSYRIKDGYISCPDGCSDTTSYFYGTTVDVSRKCKLYGSQKAVIEWNYSNLQNHQQHFDTVFIQPADTTIFQINY